MRNGIAPTTVSSSVQLNIQIHKTAKITLGTRACCQGSIWYSFVMGILSAIVHIAAIYPPINQSFSGRPFRHQRQDLHWWDQRLRSSCPTEANIFIFFIFY